MGTTALWHASYIPSIILLEIHSSTNRVMVGHCQVGCGRLAHCQSAWGVQPIALDRCLPEFHSNTFRIPSDFFAFFRIAVFLGVDEAGGPSYWMEEIA